MSQIEKTNPIRRPLAGSSKHEYLNPKQAFIKGYDYVKQSQFPVSPPSTPSSQGKNIEYCQNLWHDKKIQYSLFFAFSASLAVEKTKPISSRVMVIWAVGALAGEDFVAGLGDEDVVLDTDT